MNYFHDFPYWCSSVAVRHNEKVLAGCVYAPEFNTFYTAHAEQESKRNSEPICASATEQLQDAMIFTGISKHMGSTTDHHFDMFRSLALSSRKLRINGAAALDICRVADGTCDGFFESSIYLWDVAAAGLIAEQAGESVGLSFLNRGYDVHVGTPFHRSLQEALQTSAAECVRACPKAALSWRR